MDQVEQVKQKIDIVQIIEGRVGLKKAGRNFKGLCPFHSEKTPSFMVSPERQTYKCFGCGEGGDVFTFLQRYEGMSFLESLEELASKVGVELAEYRPSTQDLRKKILLEVVHLASEYYSWILHEHKVGKQALSYLKKRGITNEAIKMFEIGYSPASWRSVSDFLMKKKGYKEADLEDVGLIIRSPKGYYDRFRGRIMFPLKDHKGKVVGFSGRVMEADVKDHPTHEASEWQGAKYINSPETRLYSKGAMLYGFYENRSYVRKADKIVLVEGELDMIPSWQAGVKNVVAIKGSAFTEEQARLIARYTRNVVMALDADLAGEEAIKRAISVAETMDLSIRVVQISGGKDPGDVATENSKKWREQVKGAVSYYDFLVDSAISQNDPKSGEGARKITEEVVPALAGISNSVVRAHYVKSLAKRLGVPEESVYEEIERLEKKKKLSLLKGQVKEIEESGVPRRERVEEYILSLVLQFHEELEGEIKKLEIVWFSNPAIVKVVEEVIGWGDGKFSIKKLGKKLPAELQELLDRTYLRDLSGIAKEDKIVKEFEKTRIEVAEFAIRDEMKKLSNQIAKAEKEGNKSRLKSLQNKFSEFSKKLMSLG